MSLEVHDLAAAGHERDRARNVLCAMWFWMRPRIRARRSVDMPASSAFETATVAASTGMGTANAASRRRIDFMPGSLTRDQGFGIRDQVGTGQRQRQRQGPGRGQSR
jgi:hypothetical protein